MDLLSSFIEDSDFSNRASISRVFSLSLVRLLSKDVNELDIGDVSVVVLLQGCFCASGNDKRAILSERMVMAFSMF